MLARGLTLIALLFTSLPLLAEQPVTQLKTCHLQGRIRLTEATQLICDSDMLVDDGAEIVTEGHELQIFVYGRAYFGGSSHGFKIRSFDEASVDADIAGSGNTVLIYARTASGYLKVDNQGLRESDTGGDISLEYGSTYSYDHELFTGRAAGAEMFRSGELVALTGPARKPVN